jgi:hypothetical protein
MHGSMPIAIDTTRQAHLRGARRASSPESTLLVVSM